MSFPERYVPATLTASDKLKQINMLNKSRRLYKKGIFYSRKNVSYKHKTSKHVLNARKIYGVQNVAPTPELSRKTGCPISVLKKIVNKGEGAYYSSGSRPNQTPQSWGLARLASSITAGKAAAVDYNLLTKCDHRKKAFRLAQKSRKYGFGHGKKN